jgi:hypothetical protein
MSARFESPWERWMRDPRPLHHLTEEALRRAFVCYLERTVTNDRLVSIESVDYEVPLGCGRAGARVQIVHRLLEGTYHVVGKGGSLVRLHPVDLATNARTPRVRPGQADTETRPRPAHTAADMAFEEAYGAVVDEEGNARPPAIADDHREHDDDHHRKHDDDDDNLSDALCVV